MSFVRLTARIATGHDGVQTAIPEGVFNYSGKAAIIVKLEGKVALVTGGNSGIGLATAKLFRAQGAFVYICGRRRTELQQAAAEIGGSVAAIPADVSKLADLDMVYKAIAADGRRLDILMANAGAGAYVPLSSITEEHYDTAFDTNVKGLLFTVQKALPHFNDGGSIILTGAEGYRQSRAVPGIGR